MTAEIIQFPTPEGSPTYFVWDVTNGDRIVAMNNQANARNVARLFADDWRGDEFTVEDNAGNTIFTAIILEDE